MINLKLSLLLSLFFVLGFSQSGLGVEESDYYTPTSSFNQIKNLVDDYGVDNDFSTNDSEQLQTALNVISTSGGGKLIIPAGNYSFASIRLRSNVHIEIDPNAVIKPASRESRSGKRNYAMFHVTSESGVREPIVNVSITCTTDDKFTIDLFDTNDNGDARRVRVFDIRNVDNLLLSNFEIIDHYTRFASLEFLPLEIDGVQELFSAKNVLIKNIEGKGIADYGYGLIQVRTGHNMMFKNLGGIGGTTLRLEGHLNVLRAPGGRDNMSNILGRDIRCTNGNSALMLSPHYIFNGVIDVRNITAVGCGFGVRLESGFLNKEEKDLNIGLSEGHFDSNSVVDNITATYVNDIAQIKPKHYELMPCNLRSLIKDTPINPLPHGDSYNGPSIAAVNDGPNYTINFDRNNITVIDVEGGSDRKDAVSGSDKISNADCLTMEEKPEEVIIVNYKNDIKRINLVNKKATSRVKIQISIISLSGAVLYTKIVESIDSSIDESIDVSGFTPGVYIIKIGDTKTRKIIIN